MSEQYLGLFFGSDRAFNDWKDCVEELLDLTNQQLGFFLIAAKGLHFQFGA